MAAITTAAAGNWSAGATWTGGVVPGNGDTVTLGHAVTVDVNTTVGSSPASGGTSAITINATLTVAASITLTCRGPVTQGNAGAVFSAGSIFEFDASLATTPLSQTYAWTSNGFSRGNRMITCSGTSGSHVTVRSNVSGGNGYFYSTNAYSDSMWFNATYTDFVSVGDATNSAVTFNPQSDVYITTFTFCAFDVNCGRVYFVTSPPTGGGWDIEDCYFNQSGNLPTVNTFATPLQFNTASTTATGTRRLYRCRFVKTPYLVGSGADYQDNYFALGWQDGGFSTTVWLQMLGAFVRGDGTIFPTASYSQLHGDLKSSFVLSDPDPTVLSSGTATSATSTTVVNAAAPFVNLAYVPDGNNVWYVEITGGTGAGQRRYITTNSTTTLTIAYRWDTTPDATSVYSVVKDIANTHGFQPNGNLTSTTPITYDTVIAQFSGTDTQGDLFSHNVAHPITISKCIMLPNGMGDCSFAPFTTSNDTGVVTANHNTWFVGAQAPSIAESSTPAAGQVASLRSNIGWADPARSYFAHGGATGPYMATVVPTPSATAADIITVANYNNTYGLLTNGYCATLFPGSLAARVGPYNYNASAAPGANDVQGDPLFVDKTRSFWKWAVLRGSTAVSLAGQIADGLAYIKADPTLTRSSLIPYIQAGFTPQNNALRSAAHDGTDIGAMAMAPAPRSGLMTLGVG